MSEGRVVLNENQVVDYVCEYLASVGYRIDSRCSTVQKGDDIQATRVCDRLHLRIEAKGATSARDGSYCFGKPFESSAVRVHVAEAVFKALQVVTPKYSSDGVVRAGIALPDDRLHRRLIETVQRPLALFDIAVFWVREDGVVSVESNWQVPA